MCLANATLGECQVIHDCMVVTPGLVALPSGLAKCSISVEVTNISNNPITIRPKSVITCLGSSGQRSQQFGSDQK